MTIIKAGYLRTSGLMLLLGMLAIPLQGQVLTNSSIRGVKSFQANAPKGTSSTVSTFDRYSAGISDSALILSGRSTGPLGKSLRRSLRGPTRMVPRRRPALGNRAGVFSLAGSLNVKQFSNIMGLSPGLQSVPLRWAALKSPGKPVAPAMKRFSGRPNVFTMKPTQIGVPHHTYNLPTIDTGLLKRSSILESNTGLRQKTILDEDVTRKYKYPSRISRPAVYSAKFTTLGIGFNRGSLGMSAQTRISPRRYFLGKLIPLKSRRRR